MEPLHRLVENVEKYESSHQHSDCPACGLASSVVVAGHMPVAKLSTGEYACNVYLRCKVCGWNEAREFLEK